MVPVTVEAAQPLAMEPGSPELLAWLMFELVLVSVWLAVLCGGLLVASPGLAGCWSETVQLQAWPEGELLMTLTPFVPSVPSVGLVGWLSNVSPLLALGSWPAATSPS
jgi:hypothetical protein